MKKSFLTLACGVIFMFASIFSLSACGTKIVDEASIDSTNAKTTYSYGEAFDASGLSVTLTYEDDTNSTVAYADFVSNKITIDSSAYVSTTAGTYEIVVIYDNSATIRDTYDVTVADATENGFRLDTSALDLTYAVNEDLDLSGLKVYKTFVENVATLENREIAESITENDGGYTIESNFNKALGGVYNVTISYGSYTDISFNVTVQKTLSSLSLTAPTKTTYAYGEALDLTGLVVTKIFNDTTTETIAQGTESTNYSVSGYNATTTGTQTITITYNGDSTKTTSFDITVNVPTENGFRVDTTNAKTTYAVGDTLDLSGLKVYKTFAESAASSLNVEITQGTESDEYAIDSTLFNGNLGGTYAITISYGAYQGQHFDVVVEKELAEVVASGTSSTFAFNTSFEIIQSGLIVTLIYDDATEQVISEGTADSDYTLTTNYVIGQYGEKTMTVTYNGDTTQTTEINFTVNEPTLIGLTLDTSDIVTKFVVGSESSPDLSKLDVYKLFELYNGERVTISEKAKNTETGAYLTSEDEGYTDGYEVSVSPTFSTTAAGTFTYTISFGGFSQTFDVNVVTEATSIAEDLINTTFPKIYAYGADISNYLSKLSVLAYRGVSDTTGDNIPLGTIGESFSVDCSAYVATTSGTYDIIVTYNNNTSITCTIQVTVQVAEATSISIDRAAIPTLVTRGTSEDQTWSFDNLIVTLTYADNHTETLANNSGSGYYLDLGGYDINTVGTYTITVSYNGVDSKTFQIQVQQSDNDFLWYVLDSSHRVIFKGITYNFDSPYSNILVYSGNDNTGTLVQTIQTGGVLADLPVGDYYFTYDYGSVAYTMHYKLVNYVNYFDYGTDYSLNQSTISSLGTTDSKYISGTSEYICLVGTGSEYYFDIKVKELGVSSAYADSNIVDYTFTKWDETAQGWVSVDTSLTTLNGYKFTFDDSLIGETVKCEASLKYQNRTTNDVSSLPLKVLSYVFKVNDGYNVFNDADMEVAFGNRSVQTINIQRNITVALSAGQYNDDGSVRNISAGEELYYIDYDRNGNVIANRSGNAYVRAGYNINGDNLVINGNYFNIDASGLNLLTLTGIYANQPDGFLNPNGTDEGRAINAQSAIFSINTIAQSDYTARAEVLNSVTTAEALQTAISNQVTFNNLTIIGNTQTPTGDATDEEQIAVAIANSGGYSGIRSADSDIITNNVNIRFTTIGIYATSIPTDIYATDTEITECWANNLYVYQGGTTKLTNCDFSYAGGASIWIEDHDIRLGIFNPSFEMDANTQINNWVSGTEAWFVVHNMSLLATGIKSQLDSGIKSSLGKTIIKVETNPTTGQQFELFNFAVVMATFPKTVDLQTEYGSGYASTTPVIGFTINGIEVERNFADAWATVGMPVGITEKVTDLVTEKAINLGTRAAGGSVILQNAIGSSDITTIAQGYTAVEAILSGEIEANISSALSGVNTILAAYHTGLVTTQDELVSIIRKVINETTLTTNEGTIYSALVTAFTSTFVTDTTTAAVNGMLGISLAKADLQTNIITYLTTGTMGNQDLYDATILVVMSAIANAKASSLSDALMGYGVTYLMATQTTNYIEVNQVFGDYSNLTMITEFFDDE